MKIRVLPRAFFAKLKGTPDEKAMLGRYKIISINASRGCDSKPPFSPECLPHPNLLILVFDDVAAAPVPAGDTTPAIPFDRDMAARIMNFVGDGETPLFVHCSAGVSRSGAVGEMLNWYFNRYLKDNAEDFDDFIRNNRQIVPNPLVRKTMLRFFEDCSPPGPVSIRRGVSSFIPAWSASDSSHNRRS